jgi:hypothetical protein
LHRDTGEYQKKLGAKAWTAVDWDKAAEAARAKGITNIDDRLNNIFRRTGMIRMKLEGSTRYSLRYAKVLKTQKSLAALENVLD